MLCCAARATTVLTATLSLLLFGIWAKNAVFSLKKKPFPLTQSIIFLFAVKKAYPLSYGVPTALLQILTAL